jgi:tRNA(fMet)-specific endonuclease VapC
MKYSLDTNTCIRYINGRSQGVLRKLPTIAPQDIIVCSVVRAELWYGAAKSHSPEQTRKKQNQFLHPYSSLPFDDEVASVYAQLRAQLEKLGTTIGPLDMQIASIALTYNLILVTHNTREFGRIAQLQIEDWEI